MAFLITPDVHVDRDSDGVPRLLSHIQKPYSSEDAGFVASPVTPVKLAAQYVRDVAPIYQIDNAWLSKLEVASPDSLSKKSTMLHLAGQKTIMNTTIVSFVQTHAGLPVWQGGVSVRLNRDSMLLTSSQSSVHLDIDIALLSEENSNRKKLTSFSASDFASNLSIKKPSSILETSKKGRLLIYRYDPASRYDPEAGEKGPFEQGPPTIDLPSVPRTIKAGKHYIVHEVLFQYEPTGWGKLNWRAFVEPVSGAVLYLRAFVASALGNVFPVDPTTSSGDITIDADSPATDLDPLVESVTINGLTPPDAGDPQPLSGEFIELTELVDPPIDPPTAVLPAGDFSFSAVDDADDFSAVSTYYHLDSLFRMMEDMGFDFATYFDGTDFPIPADHRGEGSDVQGHCHGNASGDGVGRFRFGLSKTGAPLGIAVTKRVISHEFSHALLHDSVHSPNFGFAHSAGDALASILGDPDSQAPDRGECFPWMAVNNPGIDRRNDYDVAAGWAWGGANDTTSRNGERILTTTLFRIYQAIGGDDIHGDPAIRLARRQFAARYMAYLIIRGIGSLATDPITPSNNATVYASALMDADKDTTELDGHPGGAFHKVIRWGFEKQGMYQAPGAATPVTTEGAPPEVDVYIDDGRGGEYEYQWNFWQSQDMWNRLSSDGGTTHVTPILDEVNYMYVRVRNRGQQQADNVKVKAYHCRPGMGLTWPDSWQPMQTPELNASGSIASGGDTIVGPFEWIPRIEGHECLLAIAEADGDKSNANDTTGLACATGPIGHWRFVPFDNNIGQRNVAPVPGGGGGFQLASAFENRMFTMANPYERTVRVELEAILPAFLRKRGYELQFLNEGGKEFSLGPLSERKIVMKLKTGGDFTPDEVPAKKGPVTIDVIGLIDKQAIGGMSYQIDPSMKKPAKERRESKGKGDCTDIAQKLLDCMEITTEKVKRVRIKRVIVSIDIEDDCC